MISPQKSGDDSERLAEKSEGSLFKGDIFLVKLKRPQPRSPQNVV